VRYLHLQSGSNASGTVSTSTLLGLTGDTGTTVAAGDYHLHLDVTVGASRKNPTGMFPNNTFR
jgi:hypothetical protein